ncbi:MAG: spore photoproduct lyase family protein [Candidatus Margulisiibacteriota bacterium]
MKTIYIENAVKEQPLTIQILERNPDAQVNYIDRYKELPKDQIFEDDFVLINYKGRFLEKCPGTQKHICCNYYVINWAVGCPYNCTYCYLHGYKNFPGIIIHANTSDMLTEIDSALAASPERIFRIGTGEFTDSVALESATGFNTLVLPEILKHKNAVVELKTKCGNIDEILSSELTTDNSQLTTNLIFAWSLNPPEVTAADELGAATLEERLQAARKCRDAGYRVSFHFDPIIDYPGWEEGYKETIKKIFDYVNPEDIAWISMGTLRFNPKVKKAALEKFPQTIIYYGELLPGIDGKLRYFKPMRVEMFKQVYAWLREYAPEAMIYLCMESPEVWQEVFGARQYRNEKMSYLFG